MKIAFLVKDLGPSQLAHDLILGVNRVVRGDANERADAVIMYEKLVRPCLQYDCAVTQLAEGWTFDGAVVATSVSTAQKMARMPAAKTKAFYVWDLEWLREPGRTYEHWRSVYSDLNLILLARSEDHAAAIRNAWNRPVRVVPDFDMSALLEAIR